MVGREGVGEDEKGATQGLVGPLTPEEMGSHFLCAQEVPSFNIYSWTGLCVQGSRATTTNKTLRELQF